MITCHYCNHFYTIKSYFRVLERQGTGKNISIRYCRLINKKVTSSTEACKHLERAKQFWCNKSGHWMDALACINRQRKKVCKCKQGEIIVSLSRRPLNTTPKIGKRKCL